MQTIEVNGITAADGATPLLAASQTGVASGRKVYTQAVIGLIDLNLFFVQPGGKAAINDYGYRLDVAHVIQSGPATPPAELEIVDMSGNELVEVIPILGGTNQAVLSRSFPVPPGYIIRVISDTIVALRLSCTQLPTPADVQYFVSPAPPPA